MRSASSADSYPDLIAVGACSWSNPCSFTLYEGQEPNPALGSELQSEHAQFERHATQVVAADLSAWLVDLVADAMPDRVLSGYARSLIYSITGLKCSGRAADRVRGLVPRGLGHRQRDGICNALDF